MEVYEEEEEVVTEFEERWDGVSSGLDGMRFCPAFSVVFAFAFAGVVVSIPVIAVVSGAFIVGVVFGFFISLPSAVSILGSVVLHFFAGSPSS
jgi:hypothetical protein